MMQPHERRSADAQRDCTAQSAEKAAHGDYLMSTTLTGAVFWIVERCVCLILRVFSTGFGRALLIAAAIYFMCRFAASSQTQTCPVRAAKSKHC